MRATKYFLQPEVLHKYSVDPGRIGISGDSAGGNLAAAVGQQVTDCPAMLVVGGLWLTSGRLTHTFSTMYGKGVAGGLVGRGPSYSDACTWRVLRSF